MIGAMRTDTRVACFTNAARRASRIFLLLVVSCMFVPAASAATCCKCTASADPKTNICINTAESNCQGMPAKSANAQVKTLTCTQSLDPSQCKTVAAGGICGAEPQEEFLFSSPATQVDTQAGTVQVQPPTLGISIPGLQFASVLTPVNGKLSIPFFAQYIAAVYRYLIGMSAIAAAVMIVWGGFLYIFAATGAKVRQGKTVIIDAVIGLALVLGAYVILTTLNPSLATLNSINVEAIRPVEEAWFAVHGTADPIASAAAAEAAEQGSIGGMSTAPTKPPEGELPSVVEKVDIRNIPFDKSLGGPANINNFCTPASEAKQATTYDQKIKLLVKAVLGWEKTCVQNKLCAYCQACSTSIPGGNIVGNPAPNYAVTQFINRNIAEGLPENLWANQPDCIEAWNKPGGPYAVNGMPQCAAAAKAVYQKYFIDKFAENKLFAGDCGSFALTLYRCANAAFKKPPTEEAYDPRTKKTVNTVYLSEKSLGKFDGDPASIISSRMNADLVSVASKKGGMKFGDLVYTCCGGGAGDYSAHWFMYTGGRPDVPFSFIEMGGGSGVAVPDLGQVSGVHTQPANWTIQDYIDRKTKGTPFLSKTGKVLFTSKPQYDPNKGLIFVWRPYAE